MVKYALKENKLGERFHRMLHSSERIGSRHHRRRYRTYN